MRNLEMFINGDFVKNNSDKWIDVLNPATEELASRMPDGTPEDAKKAINAADEAQPEWEKLPAIVRAGYLYNRFFEPNY